MKKDIFNKKNILVFIAIIAIIAAIILLVVFDPFKSEKNNSKKNSNSNTNTNEIKEITNKDELNDAITVIGKEYYENEYYPLVEKTDLEKHTEFGINIYLSSIGKIVDFSEDLEKNLKKYDCDTNKTKFQIYPKAPFGANDYTIKVDVVCNK